MSEVKRYKAGVHFPENYLPHVRDVVLAEDYDAALAREAAERLRADVAVADCNEAERREAALREELSASREVGVEDQLTIQNLVSERDALQQRLTVAEQRAGELEGMLKGSLESVKFDLEKCESREAETYLVALIASIEAALKPAEEVKS